MFTSVQEAGAPDHTNIFNVFFRYKLQWSFLEQGYCPCTLVSPLLSRYDCSDTAQISCYSTFKKNHQYQSYVSRSFLKRQQMQLWKKNLLWLFVNYCPSYSVWQDYFRFLQGKKLALQITYLFLPAVKIFRKSTGKSASFESLTIKFPAEWVLWLVKRVFF